MPYRNPAPDNRWQRGLIVDAVYLGDAAETIWAEWYRHLAEAGIPPAARLPVELLELEGRHPPRQPFG